MTKEEIITDVIRKIKNDELLPGGWLVERDLSAIYGVSRSPIREILRILEGKGLLECLANRGYRVKELDFEAVIGLFQSREAVEGMAARLAGASGDAVGIKELAQARELLLGVNVGKYPGEGMALGNQIHEIIVKMANNVILAEFYDKIKHLSILTRNITKKFAPIEETSKSAHLAIIDAVVSQDPAASEARMREHLRTTCDTMIDSYFSSCLRR